MWYSTNAGQPLTLFLMLLCQSHDVHEGYKVLLARKANVTCSAAPPFTQANSETVLKEEILLGVRLHFSYHKMNAVAERVCMQVNASTYVAWGMPGRT